MAQLFRESGIEYENINYFTEKLTEEKLRSLLKKLGLAPFDVLRRNELIFAKLNLSPETAPDQIIKLIVEHPSLLQRPIVEFGDCAILARPIEKATDLINSKK